MSSLWGEEFIVKEEPSAAKKLVQKVKDAKTPNVVRKTKAASTKLTLYEQVVEISENVLMILGKRKDEVQVIKTKDDFVSYIQAVITNGVVAVDTETNNSLDPITCKLMGLCLYTPGEKSAYVPINHTDMIGTRLDWQLTEEDVKEQLSLVVQSNVNIIMHNAKFDIQVLYCTCDVMMPVKWDTMIGARILNENELAGLKPQYISKIDPTQEKYDIEHLFKGIEYAVFSPEIFALYAATDSYMTYHLYVYQLQQFEQKGNERLYNLFLTVEMPLAPVIVSMELTGVCLDTEYAERLKIYQQQKIDDLTTKIDAELAKYADRIAKWRLTDDATYMPPNPKKAGAFKKSKTEQLKDPPVLTSPTQLAILLYDVLQQPVIDKKSPRGTGEDIIKQMDLPLCSLILEQRHALKLMSTYIEKLPTCIHEKTGRLHAKFDQMGAGTGRFSSSDPNLQNIPSKDKSIRLMFVPTDGYVFIGSDYSQQEPKLLATFCQDENMMNAYHEKKDLYATMAASVYNNKYEDNLEFFSDGTPNPEGKKRRGNCKSLLLGLMYGRGVASIASQLNCEVKEAQKISDDFYRGFPRMKQWVTETQEFAKANGYVEDLWGRRRRLPDIQRDPYTIITKNGSFNPLLGSKGLVPNPDDALRVKYLKKLENCRGYKDKDKVKQEASYEGVTIHDNGGFIAQAERQCVNARIQGSAATMSKKAMILVHNDSELTNLGFRLLLAVHDELIGECPIDNADAVADRLTYIMNMAAQPECTLPMNCDASIISRWYIDDFSSSIAESYEHMIEAGENPEVAQYKLQQKNPMISPEVLEWMMVGSYDIKNQTKI